MLITLVTVLGIPLGISLFLLYQIIKDPNRIDQYIAIVSRPIYVITKWWSKKYIGAEVSYQVTEFFNRHIIKNIANQSNIKVEINWVIDEEDPILKEDNTVIICLKKDRDQSRNILKAAETTIPIVTFNKLRSNIQKHVTKSIDLVSLRNLAIKLGNHGKYSYKKHFLDPQTEQDERIGELFQKLVEIDNRGYFVPIFLNELEYVSDGVFSSGDNSDHTDEIVAFIEYLISISRIEVGDEVKQWSYFSRLFNAGVILLANNEKMITKGVMPYIDRITTNLRQGHESIYILSEESSWEFLIRYERAIEENDRILIKGNYLATGIVRNDHQRKSKVKIVLLRKIDIYVDDVFKEKIDASNIEIGKTVFGEITDVYLENAVVSVMGIDAFIKKVECSWYSIQTCGDVLKVGEKREFLVKAIDQRRLSIELSLRYVDHDPWIILDKLKVGEKVGITILARNSIDFIGRDYDGHELFVPIKEISWFDTTEDQKNRLIGKNIEVIVINVDDKTKLYHGSLRQVEKDPWAEINRKIRPGTEFIGKVTEVNPNFIRVDIKDGLNGVIPKERLFEAGGLYKNFVEHIVVGQGIDVIVTKVFVARKKIHLDLKK